MDPIAGKPAPTGFVFTAKPVGAGLPAKGPVQAPQISGLAGDIWPKIRHQKQPLRLFPFA
ncbi:hypothetical protein DMX04_01435 [Pseudomonas koreensis]|nr:hypothetical protein DMX04_01435 [Pseudomonas koreensis]